MPETVGFSINRLAEQLGHDRRSLKTWLEGVAPVGNDNGHPTYALEDVQKAVERALQKRRGASAARERLINLQADKLAFQVSVLKKEFVAVKDVEAWVGEMIAQSRRVLESGPSSLAPQVVGVSIAEAESLLKQWVFDVLTQLHTDPLGEEQSAPPSAPEEQPQFTVTEHA